MKFPEDRSRFPCTSDTKFDTLASRILGGDPVDMFPYEWDAVPNGVTKDQYQPLDDYLDLSDDIWSDMTDVIDMFQYKGKHYCCTVLPV